MHVVVHLFDEIERGVHILEEARIALHETPEQVVGRSLAHERGCGQSDRKAELLDQGQQFGVIVGADGGVDATAGRMRGFQHAFGSVRDRSGCPSSP